MKHKFSIFLTVILIISVSIIAWTIKQGSYTGEDAWNELLALEADITMDDLKAKGYIDVSRVMDSENKKITAFLEDARNRNNCKLRIANMIEGKLCAKILVYNSDLDAIKMWTVYPNQEYAQNPGKQFSTETYAIEEDGVITVWLKNIPNTTIPIPAEDQTMIDENFFSYIKK